MVVEDHNEMLAMEYHHVSTDPVLVAVVPNEGTDMDGLASEKLPLTLQQTR
jgi:hypothetical protein